MSISVQCPGCEKKLKAKDELAGKRVKCPGCGQLLVVPRVPSAALQAITTSTAASKSAPGSSRQPTVPPMTHRRPVRWPWYVGGGAAAICILAVIVVIFALPGKDRTPGKDEIAALTPREPKLETKPEPKPEPKTEPKPEAMGDKSGQTGAEPKPAGTGPAKRARLDDFVGKWKGQGAGWESRRLSVYGLGWAVYKDPITTTNAQYFAQKGNDVQFFLYDPFGRVSATYTAVLSEDRQRIDLLDDAKNRVGAFVKEHSGGDSGSDGKPSTKEGRAPRIAKAVRTRKAILGDQQLTANSPSDVVVVLKIDGLPADFRTVNLFRAEVTAGGEKRRMYLTADNWTATIVPITAEKLTLTVSGLPPLSIDLPKNILDETKMGE